MIIVSKNEGEKIRYTVSGNKINFADEIMLNLEKFERDYAVHIDICKDKFGMLTTSVAERYLAEIDIPARKYESVEDTENTIEGSPSMKEVAIPFSMDAVTLTLWSKEVV